MLIIQIYRVCKQNERSERNGKGPHVVRTSTASLPVNKMNERKIRLTEKQECYFQFETQAK